MINEESVSELTRLMQELILDCIEHCLILQRKFGDLKKQECFDGINDKIQKLIQAKICLIQVESLRRNIALRRRRSFHLNFAHVGNRERF